MKHIKLAIAIFIFFSTISCKKDKFGPEEFAFSTLLADSKYSQKVTETNAGWYEYGIKIKPLVNGKITKLGSKLPKAGTYRMNIWDDTKTVIFETKVNQTQNNEYSFESISAVNLEANKEYFISILSNNWSDIMHNTQFRIPYPIRLNNIEILQFAYSGQVSGSSVAKYPVMIDNVTSISGFIDFGFAPKK